MCVQKIKNFDCLFFEFLNNCKKDHLFPPFRLYENEDFVYIDGADGKQISIRKNCFEVEINGVAYTDKNEAITELEAQIKTINED